MDLGYLRVGDLFILNGKTYKAGHANGDNTAYCVDIRTNKKIKISLTEDVEFAEKINCTKINTCNI